VAETLPTIAAARERLAQAEALIYHKEYGDAGLAAYEAAAAAARVPLYERLVDPFTAEEALWEFENLFVLSGETGGKWEGISSRFEELKNNAGRPSDVQQTSICRDRAGEVIDGKQRQTEVYRTSEGAAQEILEQARRFVSYCAEPIGRESGVAA
jgi:uncharacterized protein (UPF0332 family)